MTPQWVPRPRAMVFFTGLCELAGAIGLVSRDAAAAGVALILFFIAILLRTFTRPCQGHPSRRAATPLCCDFRCKSSSSFWLGGPPSNFAFVRDSFS